VSVGWEAAVGVAGAYRGCVGVQRRMNWRTVQRRLESERSQTAGADCTDDVYENLSTHRTSVVFVRACGDEKRCLMVITARVRA